ncbi:hypothetical protein M8C21_017596 [Ambrosia artemisiifolia]|uniref:Uncharacterized protein n=1 Tax=Ambrosia artemisiifolia TaxID=4212 RepID=A0AAD5GCJ2_AMBAR|nr:hypothetical protein M8C21_017596 [Ambrosia artemisiifolia]
MSEEDERRATATKKRVLVLGVQGALLQYVKRTLRIAATPREEALPFCNNQAMFFRRRRTNNYSTHIATHRHILWSVSRWLTRTGQFWAGWFLVVARLDKSDKTVVVLDRGFEYKGGPGLFQFGFDGFGTISSSVVVPGHLVFGSGFEYGCGGSATGRMCSRLVVSLISFALVIGLGSDLLLGSERIWSALAPGSFGGFSLCSV